MPIFEDAVDDAAEAQQAIRGLAQATQSMSDPGQGYAVMGSLTWGLASLEFVLAQLARFYETTASGQAEVHGDHDAGHAAAHRVAEHLRASSDQVARAVESVTRAHNAEPEIAYAPPSIARAPRRPARTTRTNLVAPVSASPPVTTVEVNGPWL